MHQMERNAPRMAERVWNIVRVAFFMMGKGISKRKLILELNHAMKRGKLAGKAMIGSLLFHHHHSHGGSASSPSTFSAAGDYEFSCSSSPADKRRGGGNTHGGHWSFFSCVHAPQDTDEDDDLATLNAVKIALEMLNSADQAAVEEASPVSGLGFGVSPAVGQLLRVRVTDSPFPLGDLGGDSAVDEAAGVFIERHRKEWERQMKIEMTASKQ